MRVIVIMGGVLMMSACDDSTKNPPNTNDNPAYQNSTKSTKENATNEGSEGSNVKRDAGGYIVGKKIPKKEHYVNGILLANKMYPMPKNFAPGESTEARAAFNELNKKAAKANFTFDAFSTYRSFERQETLYNNYVARDGAEKADRYSARPGFSEHQTGLAFDIGEIGNAGDYADDRFGDTAAGKWLAKNAADFGFIMRYPEGKEKITGYQFESWHFRYVGQSIAQEIYKNNSTLEEYLHEKG
ncbi:D-alanyl-D-alanine carboxypeptidase [Kurthia sibirica]|uniref:D-alanyl-D-alanine carboxypeptidase n=3 Tax=Kurthia sibirica TaxID=202750 RepID=A0A2U3AKA4_9BACL|nr:D-alanyl-D-alanine carboxypeptidase [Kurthia sibirica]